MPTLVIMRPNAAPRVDSANWTVVGGGTFISSVTDGTFDPATGRLTTSNDATYIQNNTDGGGIWFGFPAQSVPSTARITTVFPFLWGRNSLGLTTVGAYASITRSLISEGGLGALRYNASIFKNYDWETGPTRPWDGQPWTPADINNGVFLLLAPAYGYGHQWSEVALRYIYYLAPTVTVTAPAGNQLTSRPQVAWTFAQPDALTQDRYRVKIFDAATVAGGTFDPELATPIWDSAEQLGSATQVTPTGDLVTGSYWAYVKAASTVAGAPHWSPWARLAFTVTIDQPAPPSISVVPDPILGAVAITVSSRDNLLTKQDADFESPGVGSWTGFGGNCTVAQSTLQASHGVASLALTAASAGNMGAYQIYPALARAGLTYTGRARFRAASSGRACYVALGFYDVNGALLGAVVNGSTVNDTTGGWVEATVTATAPTNTYTTRVSVNVNGAANSEVHYVDQVYLGLAADAWYRGGLANRNLLTANQSSIETDTTGWQAAVNCSIARSTALAADGTASLALTATAAGGMSATTLTGQQAVPVAPGAKYSVLASFRAASSGRVTQLGITWYDSAGVLISQVLSGIFLDTTGSWTACTFLDQVAPAAAAFASVQVIVQGAGAGEVHHVDTISLSRTNSTVWTLGGDVPVTSTFVVEYADDPTDVPDASATWQAVRGGTQLLLDAYQQVVLLDYEAPPDTARRYRARETVLEPPFNYVSAMLAAKYATLSSSGWWLKVPEQPLANVPLVRVTDNPRSLTERAGVYRPLGESLAVVVSDAVGGEDGTLSIAALSDTDYARLRAIMALQRTVLVVPPFGPQRYVRIVGERKVKLAKANPVPLRTVDIAYVEVARP